MNIQIFQLTIVDSKFVGNYASCFNSAGGAVVTIVLSCNNTRFESNSARCPYNDTSIIHARGGAFSLPYIARLQMFKGVS